jgi:hypothetical protein
MKRIFLFLFTTSFTLFIMSGCENIPTNALQSSLNSTAEPNDTVIIKGLVHDQFSNPVGEASITIKEDTKVLARTTTDAKGVFSAKVPKVFGGSYFVEAKKATADGTMEQSILVNAGQVANFTGEESLKKTVLPAKPVPAV